MESWNLRFHIILAFYKKKVKGGTSMIQLIKWGYYSSLIKKTTKCGKGCSKKVYSVCYV